VWLQKMTERVGNGCPLTLSYISVSLYAFEILLAI
jgi:hypothetical protein